MGLIATMSALVLGLLIASAKNTYDTQRADVARLAADILELDRVLELYGPEASESRELLRKSLAEAIERIWSKGSADNADLNPTTGKARTDAFYDSVQNLSPQTEAQRFGKNQAQEIIVDAGRVRLLMYAQLGGSIPLPFLVVLVSWLVLLFIGFGLLTRFNGTVNTALFIGALSVAGAIFLVLELDTPYGGMMRISDAPLESALAEISR
jgi:hypothetical protein